MAASSNLTVNVSGCVWSSLFLDHASSMGDQEGFLFGEIQRQTSEDISDSQITRKIEQISINIYSHYACEEPFSFYDRRGHTDQVKLLAMLKDKYKHTIGWYRFRRNTVLEPSMREAAIHRQLLPLFGASSPQLFLLGLFTAGMAWNQATHSFNHQLLTLSKSGFSQLGVRVVNLGDTSHSEYRKSSSGGTTARNTGIYGSILNDFRGQILDAEGSLQGVRVIQGINKSVYTKMQALKDRISESEQQLQTEIEAVRELQRQRKEQQKREEQRRMELQARVSAPRPVAASEATDGALPDLPRAVIRHPAQSGRAEPPAEPLQPTLAKSHPAMAAADPRPEPSTTSRPRPSAVTAAPSPPRPAREASSTPKMAVVSPKGSTSQDPFAGLFKDMKRSIQKTASVPGSGSGSGSGGGELRPEESPVRTGRAHSWDKAKGTDYRSSPGKTRSWSSVNAGAQPASPSMDTSSASAGDRSSPRQWNTEDSDDATQIPEYMSSASPTF